MKSICSVLSQPGDITWSLLSHSRILEVRKEHYDQRAIHCAGLRHLHCAAQLKRIEVGSGREHVAEIFQCIVLIDVSNGVPKTDPVGSILFEGVFESDRHRFQFILDDRVDLWTGRNDQLLLYIIELYILIELKNDFFAIEVQRGVSWIYG